MYWMLVIVHGRQNKLEWGTLIFATKLRKNKDYSVRLFTSGREDDSYQQNCVKPKSNLFGKNEVYEW